MDPINYISGLTLLGIPALVIVVALVAFARLAGLPTSLTGIAAAVAGVVVAALIQAVKVWPEVEAWAAILVFGVLLGLAANGAYSQWSHFQETRKKDEAKL